MLNRKRLASNDFAQVCGFTASLEELICITGPGQPENSEPYRFFVGKKFLA